MLIDCLKINIHKLNLNRNLYNYVNKLICLQLKIQYLKIKWFCIL